MIIAFLKAQCTKLHRIYNITKIQDKTHDTLQELFVMKNNDVEPKTLFMHNAVL